MELTTRKIRMTLAGKDSPTEYLIRVPSRNEKLDQDEEWCEVKLGDNWHRIRFHDYHQIYEIPGLYEALFYELLECESPRRVVNLLVDVLKDQEINPDDLSVLDVGAGNGIVGQRFHEAGADSVVGVDIIPEAKDAALRDRPEHYDNYIVTDLTDLPERDEEQLRQEELNCMTCVAALGYGDIPSDAFLKALDLIDTPGWLAFNIKEDFLDNTHHTGFAELIDNLNQDNVIQIEAMRRYPHRLAVSGETLKYVALVAQKKCDLPDKYLQPFASS